MSTYLQNQPATEKQIAYLRSETWKVFEAMCYKNGLKRDSLIENYVAFVALGTKKRIADLTNQEASCCIKAVQQGPEDISNLFFNIKHSGIKKFIENLQSPKQPIQARSLNTLLSTLPYTIPKNALKS